jgi:endoglucanase
VILTPGEDDYLDVVAGSEHHTSPPDVLFRLEGFDWGHTAAAGRLDLATVDSRLPDRDRVVDSVVTGAERFLEVQRGEPFGHPYAPPGCRYDWGSNHLLVNNLVVVATAYDLTGDRRYLDGVLEGVDYLFGRNALGVSYVTGYGTVAVHNQHSRWYANQLDPSTPTPPPGTLSGGPNSATQDPLAAELVGGRPAQQCYVDHIRSWSTNELTINWNAALAWLACFLADQG